MENKDFIGRHKIITRMMAISIVCVCLWLAYADSQNSTMIEYAYWSLSFMFAALLFGDSMLVRLVEAIKAWKGQG